VAVFIGGDSGDGRWNVREKGRRPRRIGEMRRGLMSMLSREESTYDRVMGGRPRIN
jgi:hypothetical protein